MKAILLFTLILIAPVATFGMGAAITSPRLGFPDDTPPSAIQKVMAALRGDFAFVKGFFVNEFSTQRYAGSMEKLSGLIALLHEARFKVKLRFADQSEDRVTFELFQNTHQRQEVVLTINAANKTVDLSRLIKEIP